MSKDIFMSNFIKTNITAVKFVGNHIFAGIAGELCVFDKQTKANGLKDFLTKKNIFENQNIHGIVPSEKDLFLIFGGTCLSIITFSVEKLVITVVDSWKVDDWVLDVSWMSNGLELAILTAHNTVYKYSIGRKEILVSVSCEERCILYSGKIVNKEWEKVIILAGTVFQEIVIWEVTSEDPANSVKEVSQRLKGHKGVIFYVDYDEKSHRICSTSDDRTVRIWTVENSSNYCGQWKNISIELKYSIFAHTSRVWQSHFISDGRIISIGEDSLICIWDKNGKCERQWSGHQGGVIWSVDCSEELGLIVTGGSDGGLSLWPLPNISPPLSLPSISLDNRTCKSMIVPKRLVITCFEEILVTTEDGLLMIFKNGQWNLRFKDERFMSYSVQDLSTSRKYLALGSRNGHIIILKVLEDGLIKIIDTRLTDGQIFSLHWADCTKLAICGEDGCLFLWELKTVDGKYDLEPMGKYKLPKTKERRTTAALICENYILFGDRVGSVHLYCTTENQDVKLPLHSLVRLHGSRGVSFMKLINGKILSAGRDGTVRNLGISNGRLHLLSTNKLQMDWVASIVNTTFFGTTVLGFHDVSFVIWSVGEMRCLLKLECGGGHRSWDCIINENQGNLLLGFIKNKGVQYFFNPLSKIYYKPPLSGYHIKAINSGCVLPMSTNGDMVLLTGSEDTTLRVLRVSKESLKTDIILNNHLSSIRSVVSLESVHDGKTYVFSAGGRGQIKAWKIETEQNGEILAVELASHMLHSDFNLRRPWKEALPRPDPETRYMDLSVANSKSSTILIIAGCSDGLLRFLNFDTISNELKLNDVFNYHEHCILKVTHFNIGSNLVCASMATDGKVAFWNINELKDSDSADTVEPHAHTIHSLGINSCSHTFRNSHFILATGCDDGAVGVNVFNINSDVTPNLISSWCDGQFHTCQITGIHITEEYILSCALDQRLSLFRWDLEGDCLQISFLSQFLTSIPDIHGLLVWEKPRKEFDVCVYGLGVQIVTVNLENLKQTAET